MWKVNYMNNHKNNAGFTLIELMVVIAIVGIFASIAIPSFSKLIANNRLSTATNELVANMMLARSEALKRSNTVTMCPSADQTTCSGGGDFSQGWIVFLDCDGDGVQGSVTTDCGLNNMEEVIKVGDGFQSVSMTNAAGGFVSFGFSGRPTNNTNSTFSVTDTANIADSEKEVTLSRVGRVRAETIYN